jgi:hypothetical protein
LDAWAFIGFEISKGYLDLMGSMDIRKLVILKDKKIEVD